MTIVVTGAIGNVGRPLVESLLRPACTCVPSPVGRQSYREIPADLVRARFVDNGFSAQFADAYIAMLAATVHSPALVTDDVERILGRPATSFAQWAAEHTALFTEEK
jgi:nucleoside-diphosphate-sugar epimerase